MVYSYGYRQINPTKTVNYTNFTGNIDFEFSTNQLEYLDLLETYGQVRLRIVQNASATPDANITSLLPCSIPYNSAVNGTAKTAHDFIPYLSKKFVSSLFSNANMFINGKIVSSVTEIPSADTLIRSAFESKAIMESNDSTNAINPMSM